MKFEQLLLNRRLGGVENDENVCGNHSVILLAFCYTTKILECFFVCYIFLSEKTIKNLLNITQLNFTKSELIIWRK